MKLTTAITALLVTASLTLVGCGTSNNAQTPSSTGKQSTTGAGTATSAPAPAKDAIAAVKPGVEKMLSLSADLRKAINAGDEAKVKATAPQLEDTWSTFEDAVKPKYPDLYAEVEASLDPTVAGSKVSPLDKATLGKLNDQLSAALTKLQSQVK